VQICIPTIDIFQPQPKLPVRQGKTRTAARHLAAGSLLWALIMLAG
jgi:hypothetical protein